MKSEVVMPLIEMVSGDGDIYFAERVGVGVVGEDAQRRNPFVVLFVDNEYSIAIGDNGEALRRLAAGIRRAAGQLEELQKRDEAEGMAKGGSG